MRSGFPPTDGGAVAKPQIGAHTDLLCSAIPRRMSRTYEGGSAERSAINRRAVLLSAAVSAARSCEDLAGTPKPPSSGGVRGCVPRVALAEGDILRDPVPAGALVRVDDATSPYRSAVVLGCEESYLPLVVDVEFPT